jgi:hypothetical protein
MISHRLAGVCILGLCLACGLAAAEDQVMVFHSVTGAKLEAILKELGIDFKKAPGNKEGVFSYDFERQGHKVRLYNYGGDDLWIETDFTDKATLDEANRWNMRAKFSRAVLVKDAKNTTLSLESQIDCTLGITDGMIRQFVSHFDNEIQAFVKFRKK